MDGTQDGVQAHRAISLSHKEGDITPRPATRKEVETLTVSEDKGRQVSCRSSWRWMLKMDTNELLDQTEMVLQHSKAHGYQKQKVAGKGNEKVEMNIHTRRFVK